MTGMIRRAQAADVGAMVELSEQKRAEYQGYQPLFWRKALDSREKQVPFLTAQLERENVIALVHEEGGRVNGFVVAALVQSPPVYAAGLTCVIDDFCVAGGDWPNTGIALVQGAVAEAQVRGAVQTVVVCGHLDQPKREMLNRLGYAIASEWWVKPI